MKKMPEVIAAVLNAQKTRSAWNAGVTRYALDLCEDLNERIEYEGRNPANADELEQWLLNGAANWKQYSWGGSALIYNGDIAQRLCTPSELKKTRNGEKRPNRDEEWLDTQARALFQAAARICKIFTGNVMGWEEQPILTITPASIHAALA